MAFTVSRAQIAPMMVKIESAYGTDPTPAPATDDILTYNSAIAAGVTAERVEFRPHKASMTKSTDIIAQRLGTLNCNFWWQGSGTRGTAAVNGYAAMGALMQSCCVTQTVSANTSITYAPSTVAAIKSATAWVDHNGTLFEINGLYGNIVMRGNPRSGIECSYRGTGLYVAPIATSTAFANWTGGTNRATACLGISGTITPSGGSAYTPVFKRFEFDTGTTVETINDMNNATGAWGQILVDRNPKLTIVIGTDTDGSAAWKEIDHYADWITTVKTQAVAFTQGTGTGLASAFSFPTCQVVNVTQEVENGHRNAVIEMKVQHATAESEWTITTT